MSVTPSPTANLPVPAWLPINGRPTVSAFAISQTPITNAQYQVFVDAADGYAKPDWWEFSPQAAAFRAGQPAAPPTAHEGDDLPRTNVCWYEAVAYCRWLSARTGQAISLPTDAQWQFAAQGADGRRYPWGIAFDPQRCNFHSEGPTSVWQFPNGASPFGVLDMSGNVWEWCLNDYANGITDLTVPGDRSLRGGSWWGDNPDLLACDYRSGGYPEGWSHDWGFRVVRA